MSTLKAERGALTGRQVAVPVAAVAEGRCRGVAAGQHHVPAAGHIGRFAESHLNCPAADGARAGVGDRDVQLIAVAPDVGISDCTCRCAECACTANDQD